MKNELKHNTASTSKLTLHDLNKLQGEGFRYVLVKGFTHDRRLDYTDPSYMLLIPIKDIPLDVRDKDIYEPLNSRILLNWATFPDDGIEVFIALP